MSRLGRRFHVALTCQRGVRPRCVCVATQHAWGWTLAYIPVRTQVAAITSPSPEPYERLAVDIAQLQEAVIASRSWSEVAERLRVSRAGRNYANLKALAARAEIDVGGLYGQAWGRAPLEPLPVPFSKPFDPALLYQMGTAVATAWFIGRGYMVSVPAEPAAYDLVVESDRPTARTG